MAIIIRQTEEIKEDRGTERDRNSNKETQGQRSKDRERLDHDYSINK